MAIGTAVNGRGARGRQMAEGQEDGKWQRSKMAANGGRAKWRLVSETKTVMKASLNIIGRLVMWWVVLKENHEPR